MSMQKTVVRHLKTRFPVKVGASLERHMEQVEARNCTMKKLSSVAGAKKRHRLVRPAMPIVFRCPPDTCHEEKKSRFTTAQPYVMHAHFLNARKLKMNKPQILHSGRLCRIVPLIKLKRKRLNN